MGNPFSAAGNNALDEINDGRFYACGGGGGEGGGKFDPMDTQITLSVKPPSS